MKAGWFLRTQAIPPQAKVCVSPGQIIRAGDGLAVVDSLPGPLVRVDVAAEIGAAPRDLMRYVLRPVGSRVKRGNVLALTNTFGYPLTVVAPEDGTVAQVSRSLGSVYIRKWLDIPRTDIRLELTKRRSQVDIDTSQVSGQSFGAWETVKSTLVVKEYIVSAGDYVRRGQTLAITSWSRPEMTQEVTNPISAPCTGVTKVVDRDLAVIVIEPREATRVMATYPGRVLSVTEDGVEMAIRAVRLPGSYGVGGVTTGPISLDGEPSAGCIWVIPRRIGLPELELARSVGAAAVWAASAGQRDLEVFAGPERVRSVTGAWDGPVIALSEGFGGLPMAADVIAELRSLDGRPAILSGVTHLRAGAIRPELLIPEGDESPEGVEPGIDTLRARIATGDEPRVSLEPGMRVRGAWGHRQGWTGIVASLPKSAKMANGIAAHAVAVRWDNGNADVVPVRNLIASVEGDATHV